MFLRTAHLLLLLILCLHLKHVSAQFKDSLLRTRVEQNFRLKTNGNIQYSKHLHNKNIHLMKSEIPMKFFMPFFESCSLYKDSCYTLSLTTLKQNHICIDKQELETLSITDSAYSLDSLDFSKSNRDTKNFYIKQLTPNIYILYHGPETSGYFPYHPLMGMVTYLLLYFDQQGRMHYTYKKIQMN